MQSPGIGVELRGSIYVLWVYSSRYSTEQLYNIIDVTRLVRPILEGKISIQILCSGLIKGTI